MKPSCRRSIVVVVALALGGCGGSDDDDPVASAIDRGTTAVTSISTVVTAPTEPPTSDAAVATTTAPPATESAASVLGSQPAGGPVTLVALGDSLTAGEGDDAYVGYVGHLADSIRALPGRSDVSVVNLGASGWTSANMVEGQLGPALDAVSAAVAEGRTVLATVLIGSNDLWYVYENGPPEGTPPTDEDAAEQIYRDNVDRTVSELQQAGALVVLGLPDDQSVRPGVVDIEMLQTNYLPNVTVEEVQQMSALAVRLAGVAEDVAAAHGVPVVDTNAPFWSDTSKMAYDGIHPNGEGYAELAALWFPVVRELL